MSEPNRAITVGFVAATIVAALAFLFGWQASQQHVQYEKQSDYYAAEHAGYSDDEISKSCAALVGLNLTKCIRDRVEAQRDTKRDEADLAAQQQMSKWALGMFLVSTVGLLATIGGIWLVNLNLREARKVTAQSAHANTQASRAALAAHNSADEARRANEIASLSAERQLRAYLHVDEAVCTVLSGWFEMKLTARNAGQTPARNVQAALHWAVESEPFRNEWVEER